MAWEAAPTTESISQGNNGAWVSLAPKELAHIQVERTDVGSTDRVRIIIHTTTDGGTTVDTEPLFQMEVQSAASTVQPLLVQGPKEFRVRIENAATAPTDTIAVDVHIVKDGGLS